MRTSFWLVLPLLVAMISAPGCRPEPKFDESEVESFKPQLDPVERKQPIGEMRQWKPAKGTQSFEGELIEIQGDKAVIRKKNGHESTIPFRMLSDEDQNYLRQMGGSG